MAFGSLLYTSDTDKIKGSENLDSIYDKSKIRMTYSDYFSNLCKSLFLFGGLKETMRNSFINSLLIDYGSFAFVDDDEYGIIATPYSTCKLFDLNGYPTQIQAISPPYCDTAITGRIYDSDKFVIVKLNPQGVPLRPTIMYFCDKITENQRNGTESIQITKKLIKSKKTIKHLQKLLDKSNEQANKMEQHKYIVKDHKNFCKLITRNLVLDGSTSINDLDSTYEIDINESEQYKNKTYSFLDYIVSNKYQLSLKNASTSRVIKIENAETYINYVSIE